MYARWREQAGAARLRITLADGDDPRIREAAPAIVEFGITPVLVTADLSLATGGVEVLDPIDRDPLLVAVEAVKSGDAHGCVAGASRPSADVARAALRVIGLADGQHTMSSSFIMVMPDGRIFGFGDCAVVPEPNAQQLADIAMATAETFASVVGDVPIVAMLSFSTKGSANHESVDVVREAIGIVEAAKPDLIIDGELQFDAAVVEHIAESKAPGSPVAGNANVMIFPNLAAGNIGYKLTERLGGAIALGPFLQGLASPVNDLSRGCSAEDVVNVSVITGAQVLGS